MAELRNADRRGLGALKFEEEGAEEDGVCGEVRRELEEEQAEFAGFAEGLERVYELGEVGVAVLEALEVGDALRRFEAEAKVGRGLGEPAFCEFYCWEGAEGVVDLDRGQLGGVELEELFGGEFGRVEVGLPGGVGPAGGSGEDLQRALAALRARLLS